MTWRKTGEVYSNPAHGGGEHLYDQIAWVGDTLGHHFMDPADWPELSPSVVEDRNTPYRAATNLRHSGMMTYDLAYENAMSKKHSWATIRMLLVLAKRENPGESVQVEYAGMRMGHVPPSTDWRQDAPPS